MSVLQMLCFRTEQEMSGVRLSVCVAHVSSAVALWMGPQTLMTSLSFFADKYKDLYTYVCYDVTEMNQIRCSVEENTIGYDQKCTPCTEKEASSFSTISLAFLDQFL